MENVRVADIMTPLDDYPHIPYWFTLRQAMVEIQNFQLEVAGKKSLPRVVLVFDEAYQLLGTARRRDIMRGLEPRFLVTQPLEYRKKLFDVAIDPNLAEVSYDRVVKGIREQAKRPVSDVMRPVEATVDAEDHMMKAIYEMVTLSLALIPVLQDGRVVGVLRSVDLFHELAVLLH